MIRQRTDKVTTSWDVVMQVADFIKKNLDEHTFVWVWQKNEHDRLERRIYCDRDDLYERRYNDLVFENWSERYAYTDFVEMYPEYENKEEYVTLKARLCYLRDKDLIPNVI